MMQFSAGCFNVIGEIEEMFHQDRVPFKDTDALPFLRRTNPQDDM